MTPHQMLVHLVTNHDAVLGRGSFNTRAGSPSRVIKTLALQLPLRWVRNLDFGANPAGAELDSSSFSTDQRRAVTTLAEVSAADASSFATPHPIFGRLTPSEWHRWAFLHTDHHLRQFGL